MNATSVHIRPPLSRLLTVELLGMLAAALAATLLSDFVLRLRPFNFWSEFVSTASAFLIGSVAITLIGWRKHAYSLLIVDGTLHTLSFSGVPRRAIPIAGLSLLPLESLSVGQRFGARIKLVGHDGSRLAFIPVLFSRPQLQRLCLMLRELGAA